MKTIKLFAVYFTCLFLFSCGNNNEEEVGLIPYITITKTVDASCTGIPVPEDTYAYPVLPGTDEWEKLSQKEMKEVFKACQVPENILRKQSTHAVIQTFFDYPFSMSDMYASSSTLLDGFERSTEYNPAYPELLKRKDAGTCLLERYLLLNPVGCDGVTFVADLYEMLLAQPEFYSQLTAKEKKELVKIALEKIKIRMDFDPLLAYHNVTTCLLIGRIMVSAEFAPFTKEVTNNKDLSQYIESQYQAYSDYDNILSYANKFIK
jgi:hypothetical protein